MNKSLNGSMSSETERIMNRKGIYKSRVHFKIVNGVVYSAKRSYIIYLIALLFAVIAFIFMNISLPVSGISTLIVGYLWTDRVSIRAGATPLTFDGDQTLRFNEKAQRLVGLALSQSQSIYTTDEGFAVAVKLSENSGLTSKSPVFVMGWTMDSGPATNKAPQGAPADYLGLDLGVAGNSTMKVQITTIAGAIQTGTHDCTIVAYYDMGDTPQEVLFAAAAASGTVPVRGGTYGTLAALTTTTETPLVGNGDTLNIPLEAKEIVAIVALQIIDTAVTASEEMGGHVRIVTGITDENKQEHPLNGGSPNLGTDVDGGNPVAIRRLPMYIRCPASEVQVSGFINALSAITGGADYVVNLLWR